jgi:Ca-activated chloride channel family protein
MFNIFKSLKNIHKNLTRSRSALLAIAAIAISSTFLIKPASAAGLMTPSNGGPALTLAEQHVEVTIENGYSVTQVEQVFKNPHSADRNARYSFPVPKNAAVGEFTFWIDGQPVHAEVLEKQAARDLHNSEKQQGRETAIVEKNEYKTFEVDVSPVRAGQDVRIRLVYLQKQMVDHSMGRYVYPLEEGGVDEVRDSFWTRNDGVTEAFSFRMKLRSAYPVDAVRATNGQAQVTQLDSGEWEVVIDAKSGNGASHGNGLSNAQIAALEEAQTVVMPSQINPQPLPIYSLDKDIVVYWRLSESLPGSVDLVTFKEADAKNGSFMLTLTPGIDLAPITEGRDWVFVLDTSGSMRGKFASLIDGVRRALTSLNPADRFKIISFSNSAQELTNGYLPADAATVERILKQLDNLAAGGGTNLYDGLHKAVKSLDIDRTTAIMLVTDGVANIGPSQLIQFLKLMERVDVRIFTAIMGNSANEPLLEGLTKHMEGFAMNVSNDDDIVGLMMQMTSKVTHEAMHNVNVSINGVRTRDITPDKFSRIYRGEQIVMFGKYSGSGSANLTINAEISGEKKQYKTAVNFPKVATDNPELERLWAFATIQELKEQQEIIGETDDSKQGITDVALNHGLVTDYTSLVVVRDEVFKEKNIERKNAARVEREQLARQQRANAPIQQTTQDANQPAFPSARHTTTNGAGAFGMWILLALGVLGGVRLRHSRGSARS